jgi:tRNA(adenine34) deaminase
VSTLTPPDLGFLHRALALAHMAEEEGNLPIGAVIVLDGALLAEGRNAIVAPVYDPGRHAEIEAIRKVPVEAWPRARAMTIFTTLEPCVMCTGTILLHGIGRVVFGARDPRGGASGILAHLPDYYAAGGKPAWLGPALPALCDPLHARAVAMFSALPCGLV